LIIILGLPFSAAGWEPSMGELHFPIPGGIGDQPCIQCHLEGMGTVIPQEGLPRKYSITTAYASYRDSPHGRLRAMGERNAPDCKDCHLTMEWSQILPTEHPDSPINPRNLPRICARCHGEGMLNTRVSEGSMHLDFKRRSLMPSDPVDTRYGFLPGISKMEKSYFMGPFDLVVGVTFLFLVLTVGTLSVMGIFVLLDLYRKLMERRETQNRSAA